MKKPFPFLDLPNDCAYNVLSKLDNLDLFRLGKLPLGEVRRAYTDVMKTRNNPSAIDIQINSCIMKRYIPAGERGPKFCVRVLAKITIYNWGKPNVMKDIELYLHRNPGMMLGMVSIVSIHLHYKCDGEFILVDMHHPINYPSLMRTYNSPPEWLPPLLVAVSARLRGNGYKRCKEKRDYIIGFIDLILPCIRSPAKPEWPEWLVWPH